jgi:uncharacterized cupredoxin-like copper-binding protein
MIRLSPVRAHRSTTLGAVAAFAATLTLVAAGCGSSKSSSSGAETATTAAPAATTAAAATSATTASAATTAAAGGGAGTAVAATETEFKIDLATTPAKAGTYTFNSMNAGSFKHNITIDGPGAGDVTTGNIDPGKTGTVTVTLQPGTYEIYCSIPTHKDKGMDMNITIT